MSTRLDVPTVTPTTTARPAEAETLERALLGAKPTLTSLRLGLFPDKKLNFQKIVRRTNLTVVHFWATWCGPCLKEMPLIVSLWTAYRDTDKVRVFIIAQDLDPSDANDMILKRGWPFPAHIDPDLYLMEGLIGRQSKLLPTTIAISSDSIVRFASIGPLTSQGERALTAEIEHALELPSPTPVIAPDAGQQGSPQKPKAPDESVYEE